MSQLAACSGEPGSNASGFATATQARRLPSLVPESVLEVRAIGYRHPELAQTNCVLVGCI